MEKCVKCDKEIKDKAQSYLTTEGRFCSKCYERGIKNLNKALNNVIELFPDKMGNYDFMDI